LYLSLYTWNLRTGHLDMLATYSGLEFVGWTLVPGKWSADKVSWFWENYVHLTTVSKENRDLHAKLDRLAGALAVSREEAAEVRRLRDLLSFEPRESWQAVGGRVVAYRLGPHAALQTMVVDKGALSGLKVNTPAVTHEGVVGRVLRISPSFATVLLMTDLNSRLAVMGQLHRTPCIISGRGTGEPMQVLYVPLNSPIERGELLITSGLDDIFPKGLPVARVTAVERSEISLFLDVWAESLFDLTVLEEVLLLKREHQSSGSGAPLHAIQ
jgi:rod shape-determining protein MreC